MCRSSTVSSARCCRPWWRWASSTTPFKPLLLLGLSGWHPRSCIENIILPKLQADRLNLDPVFILLSLGFWGALLGVVGALLSTPLTVVVMAIAAEFDGARWLAVLLSKDGELAIEERTDPA